ncbi:ATP-binding protein [Herbaspirillum sp. SJZ107]|uniref:PAS domain-containing hybrid sensor histidine kinase/response regulator n=1 Tax=Herbaspirillum sp. SJZ107 TaxID=2572881 RepID=UPI0011547C78|nr:ATP-binding protein [Herbaspirillum sp. SJZ107]TQK02653.1 signal transduction histidine kinase [Herbaspirillum sp. SJZ107]
MLNDPIFAAAFDHSPIGQYLLAPTARLDILAVNDAFLRSVSRRREDVLGRPLFEVFPNNPDDPNDVGVQSLAASIATAIATRSSQSMAAQYYPIEMHKDGRSWFQDMYWSATNTPVYGADGTLLCISHTTIDITAQVLAEQALETSRQEALVSARKAEAARAYLAGVLSAAPVGVLVVARDHTVLHRNPAHEALFGAGYFYDDGRIDFPAMHGWFIDDTQEGRRIGPGEWPLARALAGDTVDRCLLKVLVPGSASDCRILLVSSAPILDDAGQLVGAVAVSMDIEARVRAEESLREADRRKDEFLAMLAHELRNPLAPIGAAALLRSRGEDEQLRSIGTVISRQVVHMSGLIDELLDVARVTRGLITLDRVTLDASQVVAEALEQARPGIEARRHALRLSQPAQPAYVSGDHKRLVQVLANLLHNAAKFTPEGGTIEVDLAAEADAVTLTIADDGLGMTPELLARAFELFAQGDHTLDRSQGGLGIGLALVQSLVTLHGGSVRADSDGPGRGSRFTIRLPRIEAAAAVPPGEAQPLLDEATGTLSILLVDDNEDAVMMLDMLLSALGYRVASTSSARDGLRRAEAEAPDVCILDIGLPDLDGFALARALRAGERTRHATLIGLSGYGQDADRAKAFEAGFDQYYVKPVDAEALAAALARLAAKAG